MPAGRPSKLTPEMQVFIVEKVRAGNYKETAAQAAGIDQSTLWRWLKNPSNAEFCKAIKSAESEAEIDSVATVRAGATGTESNPGIHWISAMTFLERRWPAKYAKRDPDHKLKKKALQVEVETLKAKLKMLEAGQNPDDNKLEINFRDYTKKPDDG